MTDVSNLDDLANAISQSGSPKIRAYAQAQAAATQAQELEIRSLDARLDALEGATPPPPPPLAKPSIPTGLVGTVGDTRVTLVWNANPAVELVDGYQVYVNDVMTVPDVDALGYVVTGLTNGTAYTFRVSAHNSAGHGDWTASVTVTPQAVVVPPPPPSGFVSPVAFRADVPASYWPSNVDKYGVAVTYGPKPAAFKGVNLIYRTAITGTGTTNISESEILANNWQLKDSAGNPLRHAAGGWVLADCGIPAYRTRWIAAAKAQIQQLGSDGLWVDDINPRVGSLSGGVIPVNYPTNASYEAAVRGFAQAVKASGVKAAYNVFVVLDDNASLTVPWWTSLAPHVDWLTAEYWLTPGGFTRKVGPEWHNHWDEHRYLHQLCNSLNVGFLPNDSRHAQVYALATFLLDWNGGKSSCMWSPSDQPYGGDPWHATYAKATALGAPSGAASKSGNVWTRQFANGEGDG